jgi:hypothetical protein
MTPSQQMQSIAADKRDMIHRLTHDRNYCHCHGCDRLRRSLARRVVVDVLPKVIVGGFLAYFLGHVLVWIARGFPGLMRVGG